MIHVDSMFLSLERGICRSNSIILGSFTKRVGTSMEGKIGSVAMTGIQAEFMHNFIKKGPFVFLSNSPLINFSGVPLRGRTIFFVKSD